MIKLPKHIEDLTPYKAGKPIEELAREKGLTKIVKLASNENPQGPSPRALEAIRNTLGELHRYTDPKCYELTKKLSEYYEVPQERIIAASGSDAILQYIISTICHADDEVVTSEGTFIGWYVNADKYNIKCVKTLLSDYTYDLEAILASVTARTKIIYLANPNNPTGTMFTKGQFDEFMKQVPPSVLVVLDEAYTLYAREYPDYPDGLKYEIPNLMVLRTFSKDYGLAGLRIGAGFGDPRLIQALYKVKLPFEPNMLAQAGAIAALGDVDFLRQTADLNRWSLNRFREAFDSLGIRYTRSVGNFLMLIFPDSDTASRFNNDCLEKGLILRHTGSFGVPNGVRINSGTEDETEFAIKVITEVMEHMKAHA